MTAMQKMFRGSNSGGGNASASLSSASGFGSGSSDSGSSASGSQSTLIDAKNSNNTKNTSTSLKESTVELEKVVTPGHTKPSNQDTDKSSTATNHNGGNFKSTNQKSDTDNSMNHRNEKDINSNTSKSINSAIERQANLSRVRIKTADGDKEKCNDCTEKVSGRRNSQKASSKSSHLEFTKEMVDSKAFPGDAVRFDVEFAADANISVTWFFEDDAIAEDDHHNIQKSDKSSSLIIKDVCEDDDGEYSCRISNVNGEETCTAELIVYGAL